MRTKVKVVQGTKEYRRTLLAGQVKSEISRRQRRRAVARLRKEMRGKPIRDFRPSKTYAMTGVCRGVDKSRRDIVKEQDGVPVVMASRCMTCDLVLFVLLNGKTVALNPKFGVEKFWSWKTCFKAVDR